MKKLFLLFIILLGFATAKAQVYDLFSTPKYLFLKYKDLLTYNKFELESLIKKAQDQDKDFPDNELLLKIGFVYLFNDGLKDDGKALSFLKKAASEKEIEANALLGIFYERSGSFSTAISYYKKGERLGCGVCMLKLGEIFENGSGIFKDEKKALELYQKALDRNIIAAYAKMGDLNFYGKIVEKNLETAGFLYGNLYPIIEEGEIKMNMALKIAIINDELVRKKQSALKPNEAEDETLKKLMQERAKYFLIASELGNSDSMLMLANFYIKGEGIEKNTDEAIKWYLKSADKRNVRAMEQLGYIYSNGLYGFNRDFKKAFFWYEKAAFAGSRSAAWNLGYFYYYGYGVERSPQKAKQWFDKSKF